jgi:hypothetical protein
MASFWRLSRLLTPRPTSARRVVTLSPSSERALRSALALDQRNHAAAADLEALGCFGAARRDVAGERFAGILEQLVDGFNAAGERLGHLRARLADGAGDVLGAGGQAFGEDGAGTLQRAGDFLGPAIEHGREIVAGARQALRDLA